MAWLPNYNEKLDPGYIASQAQIHLSGYPQYAARQNDWARAIQSIAPQVASYLKQRNTDRIANTLLQQMGAPAELQGTGQQGYNMWQDYQNNQPDTELNDLEYQIKYRQAYPEQFPQSGNNLAQQRLDLASQREQRLREKQAGGGSSDDKYYLQHYGMTADQFAALGQSGGITKTTDPTGQEIITIQPPGGQPFVVKDPSALMRDVNRSMARSRNPARDAYQSAQSSLNPADVQQAADALQAEGTLGVGPTPPDQGTGQTVPRTPTQPRSKAEYDALPNGSAYLDPNGVLRYKGGKPNG